MTAREQRRNLRRAAYHEAGHVAACLLSGKVLRDRGVFIRPDGSGYAHTGRDLISLPGVAESFLSAFAPSDVRRLILAEARISLAGYVAEARRDRMPRLATGFWIRSLPEDRNDAEDVRPLLREWSRLSGEDAGRVEWEAVQEVFAVFGRRRVWAGTDALARLLLETRRVPSRTAETTVLEAWGESAKQLQRLWMPCVTPAGAAINPQTKDTP